MFKRLTNFGISHGEIDLWRSEEMMLGKLMIPAESAKGVIEALGDLGVLQFKDLNSDKTALQRTYCHEVRRCDEMTRRLRFFYEQVHKAGLSVKPRPETIPRGYDIDELESKLELMETEIIEMNSVHERLLRSYAELTELQIVLEKASVFFDNDGTRAEQEEMYRATVEAQQMHHPLLEAGVAPAMEASSRVGYVAGTIHLDKLRAFERMLFRATRGNMYLKQQEFGRVRDPATGEDVAKAVFVVFFAGDRSKEKAERICDAFGANRYPFPEEISKQRSMRTNVQDRLRDLASTNSASEQRRDALLTDLAAALDGWSCIVRREKAVYHTLNKMSVDVSSKLLVAEAWVPVARKLEVNIALRQAAEENATQLSGVLQHQTTAEAPPTHYTTNKFTECFQTIVESYGVARYREVNPAVLTIMTFPFLFAVMFGDLGHGFILLLVALYMLVNERKLMAQDLGDMFGMLFGGRYCILLMALFSMYTGVIYNEFFSMPMAIFGPTKWDCVLKEDPNVYIGGDPRNCSHAGGVFAFEDEKPYDFGVDPIWHGTKTELPFFNSFKMKMSIIIGVAHMNFGILNSLFNNLYFRDYVSIIWEFIPQMIFLNLIFGYLSILIIVKWCTGSLSDLYNVMIYMFLGLGEVTEGNEVFAGQETLQTVFLIVAIVAIPCMLLPKPLILKRRHEQVVKMKRATLEMSLSSNAHYLPGEAPGAGGEGSSSQPSVQSHVQSHGDGHGTGDEFEFGEVMVHQMIHTIEFVLGAVSNTASYLRLWALSLAHSQLSTVFYDRVLMSSIQSNNAFAMLCAFVIFACATIGVLMVMESLSAFLHALRLHWVEFMNKFYKGDGYKFSPFSFKAIEEAETAASGA